jgi:hypothetical protein
MNDIIQHNNPLANSPIAAMPQNHVSASANAEAQRSMAEVQGAVFLAKQFPRNIDQCIQDIRKECSRTALAELATYEYSRGGTKIEGASIRLAEAIAMCWGNVHSGWRELDRKKIDGEWYSEIEAWAWDLEKNNRKPIIFKTKLVRNTKKGSYPLTDERDIYEHCANNAKRRERAAILAVIPGYIADEAIDLCKQSLKATITPETTAKLLKAFKENFDVTEKMIQKFIQKDIAAIEPGQVVRLRNIFTSLKDGMSSVSEWFEVEEKEEPKTKGAETLKDKLKNDTGDKKEPEKVAVALEDVVQKEAAEADPEPQKDLIQDVVETEAYCPASFELDKANGSQLEQHGKQLLSELETAFPADKEGIFEAFGGGELLAKLSDAGKGALKDKIQKIL